MLYLIIIILVINLFYFLFKYFSLSHNFNLKIANYKETELKRQMDEYRVSMQAQLTQAIEENRIMTSREAYIVAENWKKEHEADVRKNAIAKSQQVVAGKVTEHFVPFLEGWNWNAKDARFLGSPVDFIVFDGLSDGQLKQIVFVEVKTNKATLTQREKQIRDILNNGQVKWEEIRHMIGEGIKP
jgi:predicted Holliday junction resolvase-like endonuclease